MESLVEAGEEWLEPLLDFRDWLATTADPAKKREFRDIVGRDGRVILKKDGTAASRTYTLATSRLMLQRLLEAQEDARRLSKEEGLSSLIDDEELLEIRRIWRTQRQDWEDSVPAIVRDITGRDLNVSVDDDGSFDAEQKVLLESLCEEYEVPFDMVARLLEMERRSAGIARRAGIAKEIKTILSREYRPEEAIIQERNFQLQLPVVD